MKANRSPPASAGGFLCPSRVSSRAQDWGTGGRAIAGRGTPCCASDLPRLHGPWMGCLSRRRIPSGLLRLTRVSPGGRAIAGRGTPCCASDLPRLHGPWMAVQPYRQKNSARGFPPGRSSLAEVGQQISVRPIYPRITWRRPSGSPRPPCSASSTRRHRGSGQPPTPRSRCQHRRPARSSRCRPSSRAHRSSSSERGRPSSRHGWRGGGHGSGSHTSGCRSNRQPHRSSARCSQQRRCRPAPHSRCRLRRRAPHSRYQHRRPAPHSRCQHRRRARSSCRSIHDASACTSRTGPSARRKGHAS